MIEGYGFDAEGATFNLCYDAADNHYVLVADTPKSWAGQSRVFTLRLDDGTTHQATIEFK